MANRTDERLVWASVEHPQLGPLEVGCEVGRGTPARPSSTYTYITTGNPGDPGEPDEVVVYRVECWNGQCIRDLLKPGAIAEIAELAAEALGLEVAL